MSSARFWRSVVVVLSGTAMAQAIPLLGSLLIARLYAPAQFGLFSAWLGVVSVLAVVATGRYEASLAIEEDGEPRRLGVWAVLGCVAAACLAALPLVLGLVWWHPAWLGEASATLLLTAVPTAGLIAASQVWQSWAAAEGQYPQLTRVRVSQAAGITGLQLLAGWWLPSPETLALAHGAGALVGTLVGARLLPPGSWPGRTAVVDYLRRHRRFPVLSLPADSINTAAGQLPLLLVASRYGSDIAGLLALSLRTLGAPIALLGASVLDVFKRRASAAYRERGECREEYLQTMRVLSVGSVSVAVVIGFFSEPLFALAFGERWRGAGTISLWLMPMFAMRFVASPLSYMMYVAQKQHVDLVWQIGLLLMTAATLWLPPTHALALQAYSAGYSAMYVVYLFLSYRFSLGNRP